MTEPNFSDRCGSGGEPDAERSNEMEPMMLGSALRSKSKIEAVKLYLTPAGLSFLLCYDQAMLEQEQNKSIDRGDLYFLHHPATTDTFSGYGLTMQPDRTDWLAGLLMVDRPRPVDPAWLEAVEQTFGDYQLIPMTATGERGIVCQMRIEPESQPHLHQFPGEKSAVIEQALQPLLEDLPRPCFSLRWDNDWELWTSQMLPPLELPVQLREMFEQTGPGCVATETNLGVVHVCHAADQDIEGFAGKPVLYQWQLARMPTAPVLRLRLQIMDQPLDPYRFESFLNVGQDQDQRVAQRLSTQEQLYLAFYGQEFAHRSTKVIEHGEDQREQLGQLTGLAVDHWAQIPEQQRDFDRAKAEFQRRFAF